MENQLTSLMKQKYGMTKSSKLVFTEKDTLYTSFRKLADNIYKNGEWSPEDERAAVDTMIRNQQSLPVGQETLTWRSKNTVEPQPLTITIQELSEKEKNFFEARIDSNRSGYKAITTKYDETSGAEEAKENFIFLDPTNKTGTKHNRRYYYNAGSDIYWDGDRVDTRIYFSEGNMNRAIGYDKLQRDILKVYDSRSEELSEEGLSRTYLERLLRDLTNPTYSGQKGWSIFRKNEYGELTDEFLETLPRDESVKYWQVPPTKEQLEEGRYDNFNWRDISTAPNDPNKLNLDKSPYILESADGLSRRFLYPDRIREYRVHNRAVDFINTYIQDTYDVFLQREYEKDIEKQVRASAWQTKKHINKETQELMNHTSLNDHFGFIEVDNHVDLELFGQFEKEMNRISALLPKTQSTADLRLRKLGNYHALGIYHPFTQTIAIDFRDYGDSIGGIGIQSFVHEYGHFLDYTSEEKLLSLQEDFQSFVARYRSNITKLPSDSIVRNKADYYGTPTEVWARAFEIYVSDTGLKSIFLKSADDYKIQDAYLAFDETMRNELSTYFDQRFPELKKSITLVNNPEINVENELTEEKPKTEEEVNVVEKRDKDLLEQENEQTEADISELNELNAQQTTEQDQSKENSTGEQNLENSLFSENESAENRYFQVEFNESNPDIGINRYQGEIVTPELISEFQSLESLAADESKSFKFYFDEIVDGDVVKHHRMDLGDQEGINKPMYGLLSDGAVSKRRAMQIRPNRVVVGGRTAQRKTTMSVDDQQIDRYFRVESNEMDQRVFPNDYSGQVVTKDLITELYKLEGRATYPESPSKFVFAEVTNGEVTDNAEIEVGRNFAENKLIYDRLSEAAVSQEKAKELENVQPIQHSSSELKETVAINPDFNKIMQASSSEYLSDFKQALDEVFYVMEEKEEGTNQYLTRAEIDSLLDEHLTRIEKMISGYTTAAASLENATKEQKSTFLQEMLKNIKAEVTQFKENLLRTLTTKKDNVIYNVQDKTDTLRINVKNSINSRILKVNDSIKKIVEKVDQTFVLEEKELRSKIDSKTTEEQVKETTEQSVETPESPLEEKIELPKEKEEATQTPLENEHTVETKEVDQTPTSKVDEEKKIEQSVEPAAEASIEQVDSIHDNNQATQKIVENGSEKNNYAQQIEQLSKQLNLTITDEDRKAIEGLSTEEKEGLIQELTTTISESSKSVSTEEPELEVG